MACGAQCVYDICGGRCKVSVSAGFAVEFGDGNLVPEFDMCQPLV